MQTIKTTELLDRKDLLIPNDNDIKITGTINNEHILFLKQIYANTADFSEVINNTSNIDSKAFKGIKRIISSDTTTYFQDYALSFCHSLNYIYIAKNVKKIGEQPFCYCNNLTTIEVDERNQYLASKDGVLFDKSMKTLIRCPEGIYGCYIVPKSVEVIENCAFYGCKGLKQIILPDTLKSIGNCAFQQCEGLESIVIPDNVELINESAFFGCSKLEDVVFSKKLTTIDNEAFYGCSMLCSIKLPKTIRTINNSFEKCYNLSSIDIEDGGKYLYSHCGVVYNRETNSIVLSPVQIQKHTTLSGTQSIGNAAFESSFIQEIEIAESVSLIEAKAFRDCHNLKSITLPRNLKEIEDRAFDSCTELCTINSLSAIPPKIQTFSFCFVPLDDATLYVPQEALEKYRSDAVWSKFKTILPLKQ